jgi:hypothetical protein
LELEWSEEMAVAERKILMASREITHRSFPLALMFFASGSRSVYCGKISF